MAIPESAGGSPSEPATPAGWQLPFAEPARPRIRSPRGCGGGAAAGPRGEDRSIGESRLRFPPPEGWWDARKTGHSARAWIDVLCVRPCCAKVETGHGPVGLVHARSEDLKDATSGDDGSSRLTRARALWSRVRHAYVQREIGETGNEHRGPVEGVRCVITEHTPISEPSWHENVLGIDTGAHIGDRGYGRLTLARIDARAIETWSIERREPGRERRHRTVK